MPGRSISTWQKADSPLVKELARNADVFAFAYGQNPLDTILRHSKLGENIAAIRKLGYSEVILVGHSAGGLIARQFVEDNSQAGVTKVKDHDSYVALRDELRFTDDYLDIEVVRFGADKLRIEREIDPHPRCDGANHSPSSR